MDEKEVTFSLSYEQLTARTKDVIQVYAKRSPSGTGVNRACADAVFLLWCDLTQEGQLEIRDAERIQNDAREILELVHRIKK